MVLRPGAGATEAALIEHARAHLAPYKLPKRVIFRDDLPRNTAGKLLRAARQVPTPTSGIPIRPSERRPPDLPHRQFPREQCRGDDGCVQGRAGAGAGR